jgi:hypothetical protein
MLGTDEVFITRLALRPEEPCIGVRVVVDHRVLSSRRPVLGRVHSRQPLPGRLDSALHDRGPLYAPSGPIEVPNVTIIGATTDVGTLQAAGSAWMPSQRVLNRVQHRSRGGGGETAEKLGLRAGSPTIHPRGPIWVVVETRRNRLRPELPQVRGGFRVGRAGTCDPLTPRYVLVVAGGVDQSSLVPARRSRHHNQGAWCRSVPTRDEQCARTSVRT